MLNLEDFKKRGLCENCCDIRWLYSVFLSFFYHHSIFLEVMDFNICLRCQCDSITCLYSLSLSLLCHTGESYSWAHLTPKSTGGGWVGGRGGIMTFKLFGSVIFICMTIKTHFPCIIFNYVSFNYVFIYQNEFKILHNFSKLIPYIFYYILYCKIEYCDIKWFKK